MYRIVIMLCGSSAIILVSLVYINVDLGDNPSFSTTCAYTLSRALVILHSFLIHIEAGSKQQGILQRPSPVAIRLHVTSSCMVQNLPTQVRAAHRNGWNM